MIRKLISVFTVAHAAFLVGCTGSNTSSAAPGSNLPGVTTPLNQGSSAANVMTVNVGNCGVYGYLNEPCVSVTVCQKGTNTCTTIPNILLDTGSYGLRVFGSALGTTTLTPVTSALGSNPVVECAQFGSGSTWGPVETADVILGGELRVTIPVQVINSTYTVPTAAVNAGCTGLQLDPSVGYNGILGVGVLLYDCGTYCETHTSPELYFKCPTSSSCVSTVLAKSSQVVNPVGMLPTDNNGVILSMPKVSFIGVTSETGTMTIGIGTESNNAPGSVTVFNTDSTANFTTIYNGTTDNKSFIDSGSNALYFPDSITQCSGGSGFYCPSSQLTLSAVQQSQTTSAAATIPFYIGNTKTITAPYSGYNGVLNNIGGTGGALQFDWGLPFFLGRTIFVGLETKSSSVGTGSYWAY